MIVRLLLTLLAWNVIAPGASLATSPVSGEQQAASPEMGSYYVAFLRRGPRWTPEQTAETTRIQSEHLAHIREMAGGGQLVAAGPFLDDGELRGVFVFNVGSLDQAKALTESDPAVKAGRLAVQLRRVGGTEGDWREVRRREKEESNGPGPDDDVSTCAL